VLRTFVLQALRVSSESMEGTLFAGDVLFAAHPLYGADVPLVGVRLPPIREPRHGDLVVFESRFPAAPTPDAPSPAPNRDGP
jgi:signal peptidase I